ncbi:hypothetical protein [Psychromonas sp. SA13A]|uniref:RCC1 domain-containing protein n=1 Tax=Psychromonas sp. SA13A TaxID=2686346 RepID=UPI00140DF7C8|nr:hypothetical protein [Psychromonas sp. SA13A]
MDKRLKHVFILGTAVALTTACDDNSTEKVEVLAPISLGQLEVPVSGLKYETETISGTTDETGSFEYRNGETITFSLGQYSLNEVETSANIKLASLVGEQRYQETQSVKLLKAMIALDEDNDVYNGLALDISDLNETSTTFADITDGEYSDIIDTLGDAKVYAYLKWMNFDRNIILSAGNHHTLGLSPAGKPFSFGENYAGIVYAESPSRYCGSELRLKLGRESDMDLEPGTELNEEGKDTLTDAENECYIEGNITRQYGLYNADSGWMSLSDQSLDFKSVSTDQVDGALVTAEGRLFVFGPNFSGELGTGNENPVTTPVEVTLPNGELAVYATSGSNSSFVVTRSGKLYSAGDNGNLQLGRLDDSSDDQSTFGLVLIPEDEVVVDVAIRDIHVYALTDKGDVYSWGNNSSGGELGDGSTSVDRPTPLKILEGKDIVAIEAGADFGLAVNNVGIVYGWGNNSYGALAQGTPTTTGFVYKVSDITNILIPEVITNLSTGSATMGDDRLISFQGGSRNAQALSLNGDIYSWGDMGTGYMANGYETDVSGIERQLAIEPVKVAALDELFITSFSANTSSHFAVTDQNVVYAWGSTSDGRLSASQDVCAATNATLYGEEASASVCYTPVEVTVTPSVN